MKNIKNKITALLLAALPIFSCGGDGVPRPKVAAVPEKVIARPGYLDNYGKGDTVAKVSPPVRDVSKQEKFDEIMAPLTAAERLEYEGDLADFNLRSYGPYFQKLMRSSKNKMDVALVGLAALRVDELLNGDGSSPLLNGNVNQTVKSIQLRVNKAIGSDNPAIKAVTFQSMSLEL